MDKDTVLRVALVQRQMAEADDHLIVAEAEIAIVVVPALDLDKHPMVVAVDPVPVMGTVIVPEVVSPARKK